MFNFKPIHAARMKVNPTFCLLKFSKINSLSIAVGFNRRLKLFSKKGFSPTGFVFVGLKPIFM